MPDDVDPQIQALIDSAAKAGLPKTHTLSLIEARAQFKVAMDSLRNLAPPIPVDSVETESTGAGYGHVPVRLYRATADTKGPAVIYFHGGGHVFGDFASHDLISRSLAVRTGFTVIAVDYRMAPEFPFPAAVEDCFDVLRWVHDHADALAIDAGRVGLCGDSAGGNLAAVVALMARNAGAPVIAAQVLVYPVVDYRGGTTSTERYGVGYGPLEKETVAWFMNHYLPNPSDRDDWRASPIRADLGGLPDTLMQLAECDVLVDEGKALSTALRDAGVAVEEVTYPGMIHAFFNYIGIVDATATAHDDAAAFLRRKLGA